MKTPLLVLLVLALLSVSVLAFAGTHLSDRSDGAKVRVAERGDSSDSVRTNTSSGSEDSEVRNGNSSRSANRSSSDEDSEYVGKNQTANRSSSGDEKEGRMGSNKAAREMAKKMSEDMKDASERCARMGNETAVADCLLQAANASIYDDEPLKAVNENALLCANASTARERAACRVSHENENETEELDYMPEECRNLSGEARSTCLSRYEAVHPCLSEKDDESRFKCARERIGLNASAKELVDECKLQVRGNATGTDAGLNGTGNTSTNVSSNDTERGIGGCVAAVRARVFEDAKFRIDNLEDKARRLVRYGVSNETITNFIVKMEELKARFIAADGAQAKKAVLQQAEAAWKEFVAKARAEANANRTNGAGGPDSGGANESAGAS